MTLLVLTVCGLTTGCDLAFLGDVVREGLVAGLRTEAEKIPPLIIGEIKEALGIPDE